MDKSLKYIFSFVTEKYATRWWVLSCKLHTILTICYILNYSNMNGLMGHRVYINIAFPWIFSIFIYYLLVTLGEILWIRKVFSYWNKCKDTALLCYKNDISIFLSDCNFAWFKGKCSRYDLTIKKKLIKKCNYFKNLIIYLFLS